jgi:hypothetical protein
VSPDARNINRRPFTKEQLLYRLATMDIDLNDAITLLDMNGNIIV